MIRISIKMIPRRFAEAVSIGLIALLCLSCTTVRSLAPVGHEPVQLDPKDWDGIWMMSESYGGGAGYLYQVKVTEPEKGIATITDLTGTKEGEDGTETAYLRSYGNWTFLSIAFAETKGATPEYYFGRVMRLDDEFLFWAAYDLSLAKLVDAGELPALQPDKGAKIIMSADCTDWTLKELSQEQLSRLTRDPREGLFFSLPMRFVRVPADGLP